jgi:hypothetical protein
MSHGNLADVDKACRYAVKNDIDRIIQVGDWGFLNRGPELMQMLHRTLNKYAIEMWWLDGNHENFDLMEYLGIHTDADEPVPCTSRITYLPRGYAWEEDGVGFMAFGGASSVNRPDLTAGFSWFPQELIRVSDIDRAQANADRQRVDVLFSHEGPSTPRLMNFLEQSKGFWDDTELNVSAQNRLMLEEVIEFVEPSIVIHGHYHWAYNAMWNDTAIVGLDKSSNTSSLVIFDTEKLMEEYEAIRDLVDP